MVNDRDLNTGVLFENDQKDPNNPAHAKRPDKTGHFTDAQGVRRQFAAWIHKGKSGQEFLSITVGEPMRESTAAPREPRPAQRNYGSQSGSERSGYSAREQQVSAPRYGSRPPQDFREEEVDFDPNDVPFE